MDKTIIGLVGAASALVLANGAGATAALAGPARLAPAQSYAELLDPIPDAISRVTAPSDDVDGGVVTVELAQYHHHHHHHHHHHITIGIITTITTTEVASGALGRQRAHLFRVASNRTFPSRKET